MEIIAFSIFMCFCFSCFSYRVSFIEGFRWHLESSKLLGTRSIAKEASSWSVKKATIKISEYFLYFSCCYLGLCQVVEERWWLGMFDCWQLVMDTTENVGNGHASLAQPSKSVFPSNRWSFNSLNRLLLKAMLKLPCLLNDKTFIFNTELTGNLNLENMKYAQVTCCSVNIQWILPADEELMQSWHLGDIILFLLLMKIW